MINKTVLFVLILYLFNAVISEKILISTGNLKKHDKDVFVATQEWQVIKEGQKVPKGLHIRINLATGLKEAKLMEASSSEAKHELLRIEQPEPDSDRNGNEKSYLPEEIKEALKKLDDTDPNENAKIKQKFKSYEQLKLDLEDLNMSVKSDVDILLGLLKNYDDIVRNKSLDFESKTNKILSLLENLEYLVHQIDTANEFTKQNGFTRIIYNHFNDTNVEIKYQVLKIFGATVQNNANAQVNALETGALDKLIKLIALDADADVKIHGVYALGSLLRNFPLAQYYFVENGGLNVLTTIFGNVNNGKLRAKIVTLLYDLLVERFDETTDPNDSNYQMKLKQYNLTDFENKMAELGWCTTVFNDFLSAYNESEVDYERVEQDLNIANLLFAQCARTFYASRIQEVLQMFYQQLVARSNEDDDSYFVSLQELVKTILQKIQHYKHEL